MFAYLCGFAPASGRGALALRRVEGQDELLHLLPQVPNLLVPTPRRLPLALLRLRHLGSHRAVIRLQLQQSASTQPVANESVGRPGWGMRAMADLVSDSERDRSSVSCLLCICFRWRFDSVNFACRSRTFSSPPLPPPRSSTSRCSSLFFAVRLSSSSFSRPEAHRPRQPVVTRFQRRGCRLTGILRGVL